MSLFEEEAKRQSSWKDSFTVAEVALLFELVFPKVTNEAAKDVVHNRGLGALQWQSVYNIMSAHLWKQKKAASGNAAE
jgi:hypothetical protein